VAVADGDVVAVQVDSGGLVSVASDWQRKVTVAVAVMTSVGSASRSARSVVAVLASRLSASPVSLAALGSAVGVMLGSIASVSVAVASRLASTFPYGSLSAWRWMWWYENAVAVAVSCGVAVAVA